MASRGSRLEIVGTNSPDNGRCCKQHEICGSVLTKNDVVRFRKIQVRIDSKEDSAVAAYLVRDGVDQCCVGFLQYHTVKHWQLFEEQLAQVTYVFTGDSKSQTLKCKVKRNKGCCVAETISSTSDVSVASRPRHPSGITVDIVGTICQDNCGEHKICGSAVQENDIVRFRTIEVTINNKKKPAIAAYLMRDANDQCCVGFLRPNLVKHWELHDGQVAQVIDKYRKDSESTTFTAVAAIISCMSDENTKEVSKHKRRASNDENSPDNHTKVVKTNSGSNN